MKSVKILVSGRAQGVFYRKYTKLKAEELGISGTVKNLVTGQVEIMATGTHQQLNELEKWTWIGSPISEVSNVETQSCKLTEFPDFRIVYE